MVMDGHFELLHCVVCVLGPLPALQLHRTQFTNDAIRGAHPPQAMLLWASFISKLLFIIHVLPSTALHVYVHLLFVNFPSNIVNLFVWIWK